MTPPSNGWQPVPPPPHPRARSVPPSGGSGIQKPPQKPVQIRVTLDAPEAIPSPRSAAANAPKAPLNVYVAGSWSRQRELRKWGDQMDALPGVRVVSSWLHEVAPFWYEENKGQSRAADCVLYDQDTAMRDVQEIESAEAFILQAEEYGIYTTGGRLVEFGIMLSRLRQNPHLKIMLVGRRENIFSYFPGVRVYSRWEEAVEAVRTLARERENS